MRPKSAKSVTPLPMGKITLLGMILSANNTSIWMIFSFLPFMVAHFYPTLSKNELGFKAGMLGSAFSAGGLIGNFISGVISDKVGRRPALIWGLFGTAISSLCFGFAPTYNVAIVARFMWGLLNGNIGVAKTYLAEISDDTNMAKGMAFFGVIGGIGRTIGPAIGGYLSSPADRFPLLQGTIFEQYPYALPSVIISINSLLVMVVTYFMLPETLKKASMQRYPNASAVSATNTPSSVHAAYSLVNSTEDGDDNSSNVEMSTTTQLAMASQSTECCDIDNSADRSDNILEGKGVKENVQRHPDKPQRQRRNVSFSSLVRVKEIGYDNINYRGLKQIQQTDVPIVSEETGPSATATAVPVVLASTECGRVERMEVLRYSNGSEFYESADSSQRSLIFNLSYLMRQKSVRTSTLLYGLTAFALTAASEIFPLWVVTSRSDGGFEFDSARIGTVVMICGAVAIVLQLTLYPAMVARFGVLRVQRYGTLLFAINCFMMPNISFSNRLHSPEFTFMLLLASQLLQNVAITFSLISIFVLINNSCYSHQRSTVNGIGQTMASLGRFVGPYLAAMVFAWSDTNGANYGWPLNYYLMFYLVSALMTGNYFLSQLLPRNIERRKREPKTLPPPLPPRTQHDSGGNSSLGTGQGTGWWGNAAKVLGSDSEEQPHSQAQHSLNKKSLNFELVVQSLDGDNETRPVISSQPNPIKIGAQTRNELKSCLRTNLERSDASNNCNPHSSASKLTSKAVRIEEVLPPNSAAVGCSSASS